MFYKIKGGSKILLSDNASPEKVYECYLPPVPNKSQILFHNLPKKDQYWRRTPMTADLEKRMEEEARVRQQEELLVKGGNKKKVDFVDPVCERYRRQEFYRRKWGVWFMNNGEPTYITGHHYFYLQWCKFDHPENGGYPFYYEFSRDAFYVRQWCEENPLSLGYMVIGPRGSGKSSEEIACIINNITITHNATAVLQSKHYEKDAQGILFKKKSVPLFNALPSFFKPVYSHGTNPETKFAFTRKADTSKHAAEVKFGADYELTSYFMPVMPGEKVLDGDTAKEIMEDEIGKCLNPDTPILTSSGKIKLAKDISISDKLMGPDSKARNILQIKTGEDLAYRITPNKSGWNNWECSAGHKLALKWCWKDRPFKFNGRTYQKDDTVVMTIESYLKLCKSHRRHLVLFKVPVEYRDADVFIDPYLLGLWLGDGTKSAARITNVDPEVIEWLVKKFQGKITIDQYGTSTISVNPPGIGGKSQMVSFLRYYRIRNNKRIPQDYLVNSRQKRLQLLAGLIDSDGHATIQGNRMNCEITQKLEGLARDIQRLATELGFSCSFESKVATMNRKDGSVYRCPVYRLVLFGNLWEIPTKIKRKQFPEIKIHHKNRRNPLRSGFQVNPVERQKYIGFVLDGDKLHLLGDGQVTHNTSATTVADIYERHKVNVKVVWRNHRKRGLLRKTSTVEYMKEGGAECLKLWRESNPRIRDKNGQTVSKIFRYLISSLDTDTSPECCNIYGQVDRVKANEKLENSYELIKHDYVALASEMRKNPRNEAEAFIPDQSKSVFNIQKCSNRVNKIRNEMTQRPYVQGNLYWVKDKFDKVWFKPDDHAGRFKFAWFPDEYKNTTNPDERKILNNWEKVWDFDIKGNSRLLVVPKNDHLFRIASDPIKYVKTKDPRASKAAIHGFRMFDYHVDGGKPKEQWQTHNYIFEYCTRPEDPETSFEDVAMACMFLGCRVLPERNIPSLNDYFERHGLERLMAYPRDFYSAGVDIQYKSDDAGLASTGEVIDYYIRRLITFINEHVDRMPFDDTIEDWMNFDPSNPSPSHLTVSSGFTLVHAEKVTLNEQRPESKLSDWFDTFDNRGVNGNFMSESLIIR